MRYYSFSPSTGEYIGSRAPQIDPLESVAAGATVYCLPGAFETTSEPPSTTPSLAAVWGGAAWSVLPDHRGETWWHGGTEIKITTLGDPVKLGLSKVAPPADPPAATAENIKAECSQRIFLVANGNAQMNMASFAAAGMFNAEQMKAYASGLQWVAAMRAKCATLIAAADPAFSNDTSWPACPAAAAALAAQF